VADQVGRELRGTCSSSGTRTGTHRIVRGFQRGNCLLSGDARKRVEELVEAVVPFQVVDHVAERYPGADKHGRTAENLWIALNDARGVRHVRPIEASAALRTLRRSPAFAAGAVLALALGIGVNTAVFSIVHALLLKPLPHAEPNRLVRLYERNSARGIEYGDLSPGTQNKNLGDSSSLADSCN
jgi:hypothetical protein